MLDTSESLNRLKTGHEAFLAQRSPQVNSPEHIRELAKNGQHPFAVVITCSDSRSHRKSCLIANSAISLPFAPLVM